MLGKRLLYLRKKHKLRQEDLAKKIGVARTTYAMYEQGKREPDYETLEKIADFFECTLDYILERTDNPKGVIQEDGSEKTVYDIFMESDEPLYWDADKNKKLTVAERKYLYNILKAAWDREENEEK